MISVYPYCFDIWYQGTYFDDSLGNLLVYTNVGSPVICYELSIIFQVNKVVHFWFD